MPLPLFYSEEKFRPGFKTWYRRYLSVSGSRQKGLHVAYFDKSALDTNPTQRVEALRRGYSAPLLYSWHFDYIALPPSSKIPPRPLDYMHRQQGGSTTLLRWLKFRFRKILEGVMEQPVSKTKTLLPEAYQCAKYLLDLEGAHSR